MIGYRHKVPEVFYLFIFPFKSNSLGFNEPGGCFFSPTKKKSRYAFLWNLITKNNIMLFVSDGVASLIKPQLSCYYYIFFVCCNFGVKIAIIVSMSIVSFTHFLVETNFFLLVSFLLFFNLRGILSAIDLFSDHVLVGVSFKSLRACCIQLSFSLCASYYAMI